ncbi:MAG TPA: amidohydrolase [Candidatus Galloscillospira excrementavium]|nr:amidohydrolase [Candidatus Galloscillospira excrementavium]
MVKADLVIKNGKIATVDKNFNYVEAVACRNGFIIDRGTTAEMEAHIGPDTKVIDAGGKLVLPAANDSHMHACHTGFTMSPSFLDFNGPAYNSLQVIQDKIRQAVAKAGPGEWVFGCGHVDANIKELAAEGRPLLKQDLDAVSTSVPIVLTDFSLHNMVANSKAMEIAGIDRNYPDIPHSIGTIERDADGELTGRFIEWGAQNLLMAHCPILTDAELEDCIRRVQRALNENGITSHEDILGEGGDHLFRGTWGSRVIDIYEKMAEKGELTARVSVNVFSAITGAANYDAIIRGTDRVKLPEFKDRNWVKADAIKFFVDLGGPTWQRPGIRPEGSFASSWDGTEEEQIKEITRTIIELHRMGWQIAIHSCGGGSMDTCIDAIEQAQQLYPGKDLRHFLIHCDDTTKECCAKMVKNHIGAAIQPTAANIVFGWNTPVLTDKEAIFDYQAYTDLGANLTGGSDSTCFSMNWREGMQFCMTRTTFDGYCARPDLVMKREDAIRMYTINGAYQEHMEHVRGSIEVNKVADFQILDKDVMTCPVNEIGQAKVVMTICGGKVVYEA